jgi:hypothetical protein
MHIWQTLLTLEYANLWTVDERLRSCFGNWFNADVLWICPLNNYNGYEATVINGRVLLLNVSGTVFETFVLCRL